MSNTGKAGASAPPYDESLNYAMRQPPPTYEESQRAACHTAPPQVYGYPPPAPPHAAGNQYGGYPPAPPQAVGNQYYGMTHHQVLSPPMPMQPYQNYGPSTSAEANGARVLNIHPRAEIRMNSSGAVVIPPPPPGCLPVPAQLAAMQGQSVVLKQKKRSFF